MRQDAPKNGAQLFEIASSSGQTHAGLCANLTCISPDAAHFLFIAFCCLMHTARSSRLPHLLFKRLIGTATITAKI